MSLPNQNPASGDQKPKTHTTELPSNEHHLQGVPSGPLPVSDLDPETEARLEQEAIDAGLRHPNRGHDKPDIDKGRY